MKEFAINITLDMSGEIQSFEKIVDNNEMDWTKWMLGVKEDVPVVKTENNDQFLVAPNDLDEFDFANLWSLMDDYPLAKEEIKDFSQSVNLNAPTIYTSTASYYNQTSTTQYSVAHNYYEPNQVQTAIPDKFYYGPSDLDELNSVELVSLLSDHELLTTIRDVIAELYSNSQNRRKYMKSIGEKMKRGPYKKQIKEPKIFYCQICPITCKTISALNLHVNVVHKKEKQHKCKTCSKNFGRIGHLREHEANHMIQEKNFECDTCHSKFKTSASLMMHQKTHMPSKFVCKYCNKAYKSNYQLKEHVNIHEGNLEHACSVCDKKCASIDRLKMHLRSHVKTKLQCDFCYNQVKSIQSYKVHLMRNHRELDEEVLQEQVLKVSNLMFDFINLEYVPRS